MCDRSACIICKCAKPVPPEVNDPFVEDRVLPVSFKRLNGVSRAVNGALSLVSGEGVGRVSE